MKIPVKIVHFGNAMSIDMTLPKWAIFTMEVYGEIICLLSDQVYFFVSEYIKKVDAYHVSFSSK